MTDVWKLETEEEDFASEELSLIVQDAIDHPDVRVITYLRKLWDNESWESIVDKFNTEQSVWYVWWMDGVHAYMQDLNEED